MVKGWYLIFVSLSSPRWEKIILMVLVFKALARGDRRLLAGGYPKVDWIGSFPITFLDFIFWSRAYHQSLKLLVFEKEKDLVIFQNWILIFLISEWFLKEFFYRLPIYLPLFFSKRFIK